MGQGRWGRLTETMRTEKYDEDKFWKEIFGEENGIDVLWKNYCASLETKPEDVEHTSHPNDQEGPKKATSPSEDVDAKVTTNSDLDEDGAVLVEREHSTPVGRGMGGSVRRRPSI